MEVVSFDVIQLNYEHTFEYLHQIEKIKANVVAKGGEPCGFYLCTAGGADEVLFICKWKSMAARQKAVLEMRAEDVELYKVLAKCVKVHHNVLAIQDQAATPDPAAFKHNIMIRTYKVKGSPAAGAKKYAAMAADFEAKSGIDAKIQAIFHPIAWSGAFNLIVIVSEGQGFDKNLAAAMAHMADPANEEAMAHIYDEFTHLSGRIFRPIDAELLSHLPSH